MIIAYRYAYFQRSMWPLKYRYVIIFHVFEISEAKFSMHFANIVYTAVC